LHAQGVDRFWEAVSRFRQLQSANGQLAQRRQQQSLAWMWERVEAGLRQSFRSHAQVRHLLPQISQQVEAGQLAASTAARRLLGAYAAPHP
jgi:LAO/AO transport system kinase